MVDYMLHEYMPMPDDQFPIKVGRCNIYNREVAFDSHWHEQLELLYFVEGKADVRCNTCPTPVQSGDLIVVNSNELHYGEAITDRLSYFVIIIDISLLQSNSFDACEIKYITPITQNLILFKNKISNDYLVESCIKELINEYDAKETGYELAVKSIIYRLLVLLLRNHVQKRLTQAEYDVRFRNLERFRTILGYIEENHTEVITISELSRKLNVSGYHFCRLFKEMTGKTLTEYTNSVRIGKAEVLLKETDLNITEVAASVGFNDINYFSRLFKRYRRIPPSQFRKI